MKDVPTPEYEQIMVEPEADKVVLRAKQLKFFYGKHQSLHGVDLPVIRNGVTALIGPSGCGKSTLLRIFNRMYDLNPGQTAEGEVMLNGVILLKMKDIPLLRSRVGMVFQKPTPFSMSIYDIVAFGVRLFCSKSRAYMD